MNEILEILFLQWEETHADTPETKKVLEKLCDTDNFDETWDNYLLISESNAAECKNAFYAGFNTAVKLLMGSSAI